MTANVWARGLLSDEYGVRSDEIHWVIGGVESPGRDEKIPVTLPESFRSTKKTRLFPLMHVVGIRKDVIARAPELPTLLFSAFEVGRRHAVSQLHQSNVDTAMLPWLDAHLRVTEEAMGKDYWPYGVEANRKDIETLCRYSHEQGIIRNRIKVEDLFPLILS
ncbi:MAG: hypothetical protein IPF71_17165 [Rhodoferax sp.]|nr:hypothetical protein [Rhodoferax sp.]